MHAFALRLALLMVVISAFFVGTNDTFAKDKPTIPTSELECKARSGDWITLGLPYPNKPKVCDLKATDARVKCDDSKDCEGVCMAEESAQIGSKASGQCSPYVLNFGNLRLIKSGVVELLNVE
jgi:hypothetical protein